MAAIPPYRRSHIVRHEDDAGKVPPLCPVVPRTTIGPHLPVMTTPDAGRQLVAR
jgi:hypothetical protein